MLILLLYSRLKREKCTGTAARKTVVMLKEELLDQVLGQGSAEISDPVIFSW